MNLPSTTESIRVSLLIVWPCLIITSAVTLPANCRNKLNCTIVSRENQILSYRDLLDYPYLRVIRDLRRQSVLFIKQEEIFNETDRFRLHRIFFNDWVVLRVGIYVYRLSENELYPKIMQNEMALNNSKKPLSNSLLLCIQSHCSLKSPRETQVCNCRNAVLKHTQVVGKKNLTAECVSSITYMDLRDSIIISWNFYGVSLSFVRTLDLRNTTIEPPLILLEIVSLFPFLLRIRLSDVFPRFVIEMLIQSFRNLHEIETDSVLYWPFYERYIDVVNKTNNCFFTASISNLSAITNYGNCKDHLIQSEDLASIDSNSTNRRSIDRIKEHLESFESTLTDYIIIIIALNLPVVTLIIITFVLFRRRQIHPIDGDNHFELIANPVLVQASDVEQRETSDDLF